MWPCPHRNTQISLDPSSPTCIPHITPSFLQRNLCTKTNYFQKSEEVEKVIAM